MDRLIPDDVLKPIPDIKNKMKRQQIFSRHLAIMKSLKRKMRNRRKKAEEKDESLREERLKKNVPNTIENMRRKDESILEQIDEEILAEEANDEFADYFNQIDKDGKSYFREPKIMITTSPKPCKRTYEFAEKELPSIFPNAKFVKRPSHKSHTKSGAFYTIQDLCKAASEKEFTSLIIVEEDRNRKKMYSLILIHLPNGPTAYFRLTNVKLHSEIHNHGRATHHKPELILNNFNTRLGRFVGRFFATLFPHVPQFMGRQAVTFHNQRDFIFFRRHRYIFEKSESKDKNVSASVRIQEIGPRFTLRLVWMQKGIYDLQNGEYEFLRKPDMDVDRKRFYL